VSAHDFDLIAIHSKQQGADMVFGAGKCGRVIAWNRATRRPLWTVAVALHRNDAGPLPRHRVAICPGLLGGVETPMADAGGRLFVPVVDLCGWSSALLRHPAIGQGSLVALDAHTGHTLWLQQLPSPDF